MSDTSKPVQGRWRYAFPPCFFSFSTYGSHTHRADDRARPRLSFVILPEPEPQHFPDDVICVVRSVRRRNPDLAVVCLVGAQRKTRHGHTRGGVYYEIVLHRNMGTKSEWWAHGQQQQYS